MIIYRYFRNIITLGIFLVLSLACSTAASSSDDTPDEITRASAARIIAESENFPAVYSIKIKQTFSYDSGAINAVSDDESEEDSVKRYLAQYSKLAPQIGVAVHFGYVRPIIKRTNDKPELMNETKYWKFEDEYVITDDGRKLWKDFGLEADDASLPLAVKEFDEVTGIIKRGGDTIVEYTWRWKTNKMGDALDPQTGQFEKLPEHMQKWFTERRAFFSSENTIVELAGTIRTRALFRKYDDGWRLVSAG